MKLPKSLTTVTRFSKILAVLLFFVFLFGAFREGMKYQHAIDMTADRADITPTSSVNPTQIPNSETAHAITMKDNWQTVSAKVGDKIIIQLADGLEWQISLSNNAVLQPSPDGVFYIKQVQGRYKAVAPGSVVVSATGRPQCQKGTMCSQMIIAFTTTVNVKQ